MMRRMTWVLVGALLTGVGCAGGSDRGDADPDAGVPAGAMEGMPGMSSAPESVALITEMRTHLERMEGAAGSELLTSTPQHRQMLGNLIAQMNREMSGMGMGGGDAWNATVDSLRSDLTGMVDRDAAGLEAMITAHGARVGRLMEMHEGMMRAMGTP